MFPVIIKLCLWCFVYAVEGCNKEYNASRVWNTLRSPNYPSKFPPQTECRWRIYAYGTYRVKLQFTQFSLVEPQVAGWCTYQWLKITDGTGVNKKEHHQCGKRNPGTIVSTGRALMLTLHSSPSSSSHNYQGFEASFSVTKESPIFPVDTNKPKLVKPETTNESEEDNKLLPTPRNTLGAALDRLRPNKPSAYAGKTQNELVEEFNRRRNQGFEAPQNPLFQLNGQVISRNSNRARQSTSTQFSTLQTITPRRKPTLSYELRMVFIIIGILAAIFLLIFIANKLHLMSFIVKLRHGNNEKMQTNKSETGTIEVKTAKKFDECFKTNEVNTKNKHRRRHTCKKHKYENSSDDKYRKEEETIGEFKPVSNNLNRKCYVDKAKDELFKHAPENVERNKNKNISKATNKKRPKVITRPQIRTKKKAINNKVHQSKNLRREKSRIRNAKYSTQQFRPQSRQPKQKRLQKYNSTNSENSDFSRNE